MKPGVDNPHSTASGLFQFLDGTWKYYGIKKWGNAWIERDVYSYKDASELALWVLANFGAGDWEESRFCWEPMIQTP